MTVLESEMSSFSPAQAGALEAFDLLTAPFATDGGVQRASDGFEATQPWSVARFDAVRLKQGWWRLDCAGDVAALDVRLVSGSEPLILIPGDDSAGRVVHFAGDEDHDISLHISPWPGRYRIDRLRLMRLTAGEQVQMFARAAAGALSRGNLVKRVASAASRVLSGETVGIRVGGGNAAHAEPLVEADVREAPQTLQIERRGDIVAALYPGDTLHKAAFDIVAGEFARRPEVQAMLADVQEGGTIHPRPGWDPDLFVFADCATPPVFLRASAYVADRPLKDLVAALALNDGKDAVARVALPLVSRAYRAAAPAITAPMPRLVRHPRVSVLIPTKTRVDLLTQCLDGLVNRTDYPDLEVVVIDNGHTDPAVAVLLEEAGKSLDIVTIRDETAFNFSYLINLGARHATGEVLISFNDDVDPVDPTWLRRMVASVMRADVGAVGARLLYPDHTLQHAGMVMGLGGSCGHLWKGLAPRDAALIPAAVLPSERQSVTGACLAVMRTDFDRVGGFEAEAFPIGFSDVDFCLRLRALGLRNIYRGDAVLLHKESQSRQPETVSAERRRRDAQDSARFRNRWRDVLRTPDPFGSPAYDIEVESGRVHRALRWAHEG